MNRTSKQRAAKPIGVFDSGLGGLTVVKELIRQLPGEDIVYFGDTARVPYGTKSRESVVKFSVENVSLLLRYKVKMIVVACNTSSSVALSVLRRRFALPILGVIEPGVRKAVAETRNGRVGVLATQATVNSEAYSKAFRRIARNVTVVSRPCPLFVPLAEEGWLSGRETESIARHYLRPVLDRRVDTIILGCTHYPLLKDTIRKVSGAKVALVDSAREVAGEVKSLLDKQGLANPGLRKARYRFLVSDEADHFRVSARRFLGRRIERVRKITF